jgi:hypothetical protein
MINMGKYKCRKALTQKTRTWAYKNDKKIALIPACK